LLEDASKCRDAGRQPGLLEAVTALMGPVAAAGISVKVCVCLDAIRGE
jgi:hypothetical protein